MGISSRCQPHGVLAQNCKGVGIAGAEKVGMLMPIPLEGSPKRLAMKQMVQVSTCGSQNRNAAQQQRQLKRSE